MSKQVIKNTLNLKLGQQLSNPLHFLPSCFKYEYSEPLVNAVFSFVIICTHRGDIVAYTMSVCWQLCSQRTYHSAGSERPGQGGEKNREKKKLRRLLVKTAW